MLTSQQISDLRARWFALPREERRAIRARIDAFSNLEIEAGRIRNEHELYAYKTQFVLDELEARHT